MKYLLLLLFVIAGCTSIQIDEESVFEPKASVTLESFAHEDVSLEEWTIPVAGDSLALNAWWLSRPDAEATVLFFGGQGFYLVQSKGYLEAFASLPVNALLVDYRGYGQSEGEPSVAALKADAADVYRHLTGKRGIDPESIVVHGHSLGTFVALHLSEEHPVGGVVLENPATNTRDWERSLVPWFFRLFISLNFAEALESEDNVERIQSLERPLLIVAGEEDEITPKIMAEKLYGRAPSSEKQFLSIEGGGHNGLHEHDAFLSAYRTLINLVRG